MLACARIGTIHCVVFSGLSAEALRDRIEGAGAAVVVCANYGKRSDKMLHLKKICDDALATCPQVEHCVVVRRMNEPTAMVPGRDVWWDELVEQQPSRCEPVSMESSDPLFILFTSGSTAKPKGIVHGTGGYLLYATMTAKYVFDLREDDVYWCTADVGWITGHSYIVYGPLSCGATSLMFEGVPSFPNPDRYWKVVHKFGVNVLYTAPSAIRAMMREGERWVDPRDISSLRWPSFSKNGQKTGFSAYREEKASAKQRDEGAPYAPTLPSKAAISFCTLCSRFVPSTRSLIWRMAERPLPIAQLTPTRRSSS